MRRLREPRLHCARSQYKHSFAALRYAKFNGIRAHNRGLVAGRFRSRYQPVEHRVVARGDEASNILEEESGGATFDDEPQKIAEEEPSFVRPMGMRAGPSGDLPSSPRPAVGSVITILTPERGLGEWLTGRTADHNQGIVARDSRDLAELPSAQQRNVRLKDRAAMVATIGPKSLAGRVVEVDMNPDVPARLSRG